MESSGVKRVTVKLGSNVIVQSNGELDHSVLVGIIDEVSDAVLKNKLECILVSSGAIGMGRKILSNDKVETLAFKQACASVGQNQLMNVYSELFAKKGLLVGQVLVTASDLGNRKRYLNLRNLLEELLLRKVVPIINENDSVSTLEIESKGLAKVFGDNDKLSALVASKMDSDLLVLMTNVDGVFSSNPFKCSDAQLISEVHDISDLEKIEVSGISSSGRGGMATKLDAARLASMSGVASIVCNGKKPGALKKVLHSVVAIDQPIKSSLLSEGTFIHASKQIKGRDHWIRFSSGIEGVIVVNSGAQAALEESSASLLPVGVIEVKGTFAKGDTVSVQNEKGSEIARGISEFSSSEAQKFLGMNSQEIKKQFGLESGNELVHRNKLVVFKEQ